MKNEERVYFCSKCRHTLPRGEQAYVFHGDIVCVKCYTRIYRGLLKFCGPVPPANQVHRAANRYPKNGPIPKIEAILY